MTIEPAAPPCAPSRNDLAAERKAHRVWSRLGQGQTGHMVLTLEPLPVEEYAAWREGVIARRGASPRSRGVSAALAAQQAREIIDRYLPPAGPPEGTEVLAVDTEGGRVGTFYLRPVGDAV